MIASPGHLLMTADAVGGVWQYATDLARGLTRHGWRTTLAVLGPPPTTAQRAAARAIPDLALIETGLPLDWLAPDEAAVRTSGDAVAAIARDAGVDLVQLNAPSLAAAARYPVPVVAVAHSCLATWWAAVRGGPAPEDFAWRTALVGAGLAAADRIVAPSRAFAEETMRAYRLPGRPLVVHNGRSRLPRAATAMHDFCFTAGRLWDAAKNVVTLDRIAGGLAVPFRAAGSLRGPHGETAPPLSHLHALGAIEEAEVGRWLASRPVFVSAATYEPFGLAVLEAAAAGCALILSDTPTFRELWDGAATFVAAHDDEGFTRAAEAIVGDTQLRLVLGEAARARAGRYTPAAMAAAMADVYRGLGCVAQTGQARSGGKAAA